jgi:hypothetical protein
MMFCTVEPNNVTNRSSTAHFVRWTVFKSQFCGFAAQKYSTKPQLKNCRLARRYEGANSEDRRRTTSRGYVL